MTRISVRKILVLCAILLLPCLCSGEARCKQHFPVQSVLLGKPIFWIIEIRYPIWESYVLTINPCSGVKMAVYDHILTEDGGEMTSRYRIEIVPQNLSLPDRPSVLISDSKGQSTLLTGRALTVTAISGDSMELQDPGRLPDQKPQRNSGLYLYALGAALAALLGFLVFQRLRARSPRQVLLRELHRAIADVQKGRLPLPLWRLLRSPLLWGFPAETQTPSQLKETAGSHPQLQVVAESLLALEAWRYSGAETAWNEKVVMTSLSAALEILRRRLLPEQR